MESLGIGTDYQTYGYLTYN